MKIRTTFKYPRCSLCDREVDKYEIERNGDYVTLIAHCHGDSDSKTMLESQLDSSTDFMFDDPRRKTFKGRDITHKIPGLSDIDDRAWVNKRIRQMVK